MSYLRFLKNYNNYYNRIVKIDQLDDIDNEYVDLPKANFNPNDDVIASHDTAKWQATWMPDYMLKINEDTEEIESRWFVLESVRLRGQQYRFTLRRDLVADFYDNIINAPIHIERAVIDNTANPLIYNPEGFSFNQIKKEEILLKDKTRTPWYVLYFKDSTTNSGSFSPTSNYDIKISGRLADSAFADSSTQKYISIDTFKLQTFIQQNSTGDKYDWKKDYTNPWTLTTSTEAAPAAIIDNTVQEIETSLGNAFDGQFANLFQDALTDYNVTPISENDWNYLVQAEHTPIRVYSEADQQLYLVSSSNVTTVADNYEGRNEGQLAGSVETLYTASGLNVSYLSVFLARLLHYEFVVNTMTVNATPITSNTYSWTIYDTNKNVTEDSDFDMIAIPYLNTAYKINGVTSTANADLSKLLVRSIIKQSASRLVDVQLLPYCPIQRMIDSLGRVELVNSNDFTIVSSSDPDVTSKTFMLYVDKSNFTFNINKPISISNSAIERKIMNETTLYKLVSPNYNGSFEFSPAKNGGVTSFNVDVSLIPYNPYIHVNPAFDGLYGQDFDDSRGLICGGDFSLPIRTDQWEEYQLNNKNYQNIFDRQMRNMDFTHRQERIQEVVSGALGVVQGAASGATGGAMGGKMAGGGMGTGAGVGAAAGAATAMLSGLADFTLMVGRQAEAKSLAKDMFKYQLGNIKALPDNISKVTALVYNNKFYPFIEVYSASDEEKELFRNYLIYNSMTIDSISTISNFIHDYQTFIKGQLIRLEGTGLTSHEVDEIYQELNKGVYI